MYWEAFSTPETFTLPNFYIERVEVSTAEANHHGIPLVSVKLSVLAADRDSGVPVQLTFETTGKPFSTREELRVRVKEAIMEFLSHEVDECLLVDGVRPVDPHPELKPIVLAPIKF